MAKTPGPAIPAAVTHGEKKLGPASAGPSVEPRVPARSAAEATPAATPPANTSPIIAGPSFLGLNQPGDGPSRGQAAAHSDHRSIPDPLAHSSGNLDYLLEDEEEPKRGWGKLAVIVIALVLAGGFGYLRWKQGGFDWLNAGEKKPAATTQTSETPQGTTDSGSASNAAGNPGGAAPNAATGAPAAPLAADGSAPAATEPPAAQASPQTSSPQNPTPQTATPAQAPQASPTNSAPPADSASQSPQAEAPAVPKARAPKPSAAKALDPATEGERYIYGRGVSQDCDRGLRLLKPAAEQSNPKAMIALGALYSTGTCTPRDLPTAYRWFALALHKEPDNQPLQDDLQKLWSQMTQPERQLAIKLSQ
ncbi:MAG: hypothetical protein WAN08_25670 [Candidatus Sulfotelmatobacter sp.]